MSHSLLAAKIQNSPTKVLQSIATITGERDRDLLASALVSTLSELIHSQRISMYRIIQTDHGDEVVLVAEACEHPEAASALLGSITLASDRADFRTVLNSGIEHIRPTQTNSHSVHPIIGQHGVVGLLESITKTHNDLDRHLISAFLKVYSNYLNILNESETDTLTGLLNRRTFDNNIERIIAERFVADDPSLDSDTEQPSRREEAAELPHWLAVMDIDHFKRVNDKFGHLYGDEVLLLLSRNMQRIFRQHDKLFRFGGEEFVVVLDRTSLENAKNVLERFRSAIEQYDFPQVGQVTISIGFVRLDKAEVPSSIVGRADQALYHAKQKGRNQVVFYEDLITEGNLTEEYYSDDLELF